VSRMGAPVVKPGPSSPRTPLAGLRARHLLRGVRELAGERPVVATVRGGSMAPLLVDGDRVEIAPARWPLPGDLVAFEAGDERLVVHRLLGYRWAAGGIACVTQGDASPRPDPPVARALLLGRVVAPARVLPTPARRARALGAFARRALERIGRLGRRSRA
jgi:hypothetical protein